MLLDEDAIAEGLRGVEGWEWVPDRREIRRSVRLPDFVSAVGVVASVARVAEEVGHHPDMDIRYDRVVFHLSTHVAGGVTAADLDLAGRIDAVVAAARPAG
ncbi:4a-hydroxytetrahydrobiopterin dehydratase [Nocardiopsis trehalosi]|uniref:4a-hydroxytetrahydrobiopterin dehydratase n=1 Tax=Nocardiopsis trehalosi TaxID=109329 RepID=UPI00082DA90F|nr:4a-hydroxytetrahydrobiopterin dehydratase [Nocardiopsis trehalosi]